MTQEHHSSSVICLRMTWYKLILCVCIKYLLLKSTYVFFFFNHGGGKDKGWWYYSKYSLRQKNKKETLNSSEHRACVGGSHIELHAVSTDLCEWRLGGVSTHSPSKPSPCCPLGSAEIDITFFSFFTPLFQG